jgi:uncharacterized protein (UPF0147 family)
MMHNAISTLTELKEESTTPKNIREKIQNVITILEGQEDEMSIKKSKALDILDQISNENNIQPFLRTQIWNVVSILESL